MRRINWGFQFVTVLSAIAHFSISEIEELKQSVIDFNFLTADDLTYDPSLPELNLYNPEDKSSLLRKIYKQNSFPLTQSEWYLALDSISDKSISLVYDTLIELTNTFYFA